MAHVMASKISFGDANDGFQAGIINGPVNVEFHQPPERPETPPRPRAVLPFSRDADFVERGELLNQLQTKCAVLGSRTALVGLGGVGKSQLAIEYAYRAHEQSPEMWVFWVHASNVARFEQSYRDIADCVKILGRRDPKVNIFKLVHDWLRDCKGQWLLIIDNADDARFLLDSQANSLGSSTDLKGDSRPLHQYLPQCECGSILVTTRNKEAALNLVERHNILIVEPMNETQAQALFEKKLGVHGHSDVAVAELAAALDYMPLAIVQAAAYIYQRAPRCTVVKYLEEFKKSERKRTSLLNHEKGQLRRDWEAKNSIVVTWQISFEHIQQTRPSAADLLSLMSFFDRQGIPETLLRTRKKRIHARSTPQDEEDDRDSDEDDSTSRSSMGDDEFEKDVDELRNFSFVSVNVNGTTFEMHALVQLAMRTWLQANNKLEEWKMQFISNLCTEFPTGSHENWHMCQTLFAHAKSAAEQQPEEESSLLQWATLLYRAAWYACDTGNINDGVKFAIKSMKVRKRVLGQEHDETLWSMSMLGSAYGLEGRWDAAEELEVQVMEIRKKKLGVGHPTTLYSMNNLAYTYQHQGRWDAAEELEVQVIEMYKKKLGADHPSTLISMNNLASTYRSQGRWDAAEELEVQVMEKSKKQLGAEHPTTLTSMANLASTYWNQGRWDAAEELEVQVAEICKKTLGADHPSTLNSLNNLASTYWDQGRWDAAEELEVKVMEIRKKKLGSDHPSTLTSMNNLAATYRKQGRWDAAEELQIQAMETRKKKLGNDHPDTLTSISNLASIYRNQGQWDAAEELLIQVMETRKKKLGADHPSTLNSMNNLAFTWKDQGRDAEAVHLMRECVHLSQRVLGVNHHHSTSSAATLARWEAEQVDTERVV